MANQRTEGTGEQVATANRAYLSTIDLFFELLETRRAVEGDEAVDRLLAALKTRRASIRATLHFDLDGILSFAFYLISPGEKPELIIDALPVRKTQ